MRFLPAAILTLAAATSAQEQASLADRFLRQEQEAFRLFRQRSWDECIAAFERQIAIYARNPRPYYNIACCYALQNRPKRAATWLRLAIAHGWRDAEHLGNDPDFDLVRDTEAYRSCLTELGHVLLRDPAPMPRRLAPDSVSSHATLAAIVRLSRIEEALARQLEELLEPRQLRRRVFGVYDRRMAMLTRYLMENGDARDAPRAAVERVRTAMAYLSHADGRKTDERLRRVAAGQVLTTAEQLLGGWPESPRLPSVLLWRASAFNDLGADPERGEELYREIVADHGETNAAVHAQIRLCALLANLGRREPLVREYDALEARWAERGWVKLAMRQSLMKARLLARGLPPSFSEGVGRSLAKGDRPILYVFVSADSSDSERRLEGIGLYAAEPLVVCVDTPERVPDADVARWLGKHASGVATVARGLPFAQQLWLSRVPTVILADRSGKVLAVDPSDKDLGELVPREG